MYIYVGGWEAAPLLGSRGRKGTKKITKGTKKITKGTKKITERHKKDYCGVEKAQKRLLKARLQKCAFSSILDIGGEKDGY